MNLIHAVVENLSAGRWRGRIVTLGLGAFYALIFAPFNFFPVAFLVLPLLVLTLDRLPSWQRAAAFGWWFGFGHFLVGMYWIGLSFLQQAQVPVILAPMAVILLCAVLAVYFAVTFGLARRFWSTGCERVMILVIAWAAIEWARGHLFTGFPWNLTVHMWGGWDAMMQPVVLLGSYGYGAISLLLAASPVFFLQRNERLGKLSAGVSLVIFLGLWAWGADRLDRARVEHVEGVNLRLVQANIDQLTKWNPENRGPGLLKYIGLSHQDPSAGENPPTHVIWPEAAVTFLLDDSPDVLRSISDQLGPDVQLLTGAPRIERGAEMRVFTSLYHVGAGGDVLAIYDKYHLVPFGEYLPFRRLLESVGLQKLTYGSSDYSAGPGPQTLATGGLPPFSPLICYEVIFPGQLIDREHPPQWLLNITNDAWFGHSSGPYQHLQMVRFRAVEEGLPVVRAASTGISAVIDPWGRVLVELPLGVVGVVDSPLPQPINKATAANYLTARSVGLPILLVVFAVVVVWMRRKSQGVRAD